MATLVSLEKVSLRNHPEIKEDLIQKFIFEKPEVLQLGDLTPIQRERIQPAGAIPLIDTSLSLSVNTFV